MDTKKDCPHKDQFKITESDKTVCEVCGEKNNLRLCTTCGGVFCCESHLAHNREHFEKTNHPIITPTPKSPAGTWLWCWICDSYIE